MRTILIGSDYENQNASPRTGSKNQAMKINPNQLGGGISNATSENLFKQTTSGASQGTGKTLSTQYSVRTTSSGR
jgi:hypothetical protein